MLNAVNGDLIELARNGRFDLIIHGCNCMCQMGKGLALAIKTHFPEAYAADLETEKGDRRKLGTCSTAVVTRDVHTLTVVNAYTQYHWRGRGVLVDYAAVRSCLRWVKATYSGKRIGLPKIGAGLAKGDWPTIQQIIAEELAGEDVTLVVFNGR